MGPRSCCATCRYFDSSSGLEGAGWCRHPRYGVDNIKLVRGDELACKVLKWPGVGHWEERIEFPPASPVMETEQEPY